MPVEREMKLTVILVRNHLSIAYKTVPNILLTDLFHTLIIIFFDRYRTLSIEKSLNSLKINMRGIHLKGMVGKSK
jgi:hypothetical protein